MFFGTNSAFDYTGIHIYKVIIANNAIIIYNKKGGLVITAMIIHDHTCTCISSPFTRSTTVQVVFQSELIGQCMATPHHLWLGGIGRVVPIGRFCTSRDITAYNLVLELSGSCISLINRWSNSEQKGPTIEDSLTTCMFGFGIFYIAFWQPRLNSDRLSSGAFPCCKTNLAAHGFYSLNLGLWFV